MPGQVRTGREGPGRTRSLRGEALPASQRLSGREIRSVQDGGRRFGSGAMLLLLRENQLGRQRLGVTVSRRVGNAVTRNRVKRLFREIFRKRRGLLPPSVDAVLIARPAAARGSLEGLTADFERAAAQARGRWRASGASAALPERNGR